MKNSKTIFLFLFNLLCLSVSEAQSKPNVLFIIVDDLMKQTELYGHSEIKTPNLSELAKDSTLFDRAYCQFPLCGPSRSSMMLSRYPDHGSVTYNQGGKSDKVQQIGKKLGIKTMPAYFKEQGYLTIGGGKLYHNSVDPSSEDAAYDFSVSFDNAGHDGQKVTVKKDGKKVKMTNITEKSDKSISEHKDGALIKKAITWLDQYSKTEASQPFFMSLGIKKPHSPYSCPEEFWKLYQRDKLVLNEIPPPNDIVTDYSLSKPTAVLSVHHDTESYDAHTLPEEKKYEMMHGYYACVSYIDNLIGQLIGTLKRNQLYENTIIVFTSDHGYKLGEYQRWGKYTLQEKDAVVPLLIRNPSHKNAHGQKSKAIVGLIDLYPTLAELCQIPIPQNLDGLSFKATLENPAISTRQYIRTVLPRAATDLKPRGAGLSMIHENGYRFHQWWEGSLEERPSKTNILGFELYDHYHTTNTPLSLKNIAKEKPEMIEEFQKLIDQP